MVIQQRNNMVLPAAILINGIIPNSRSSVQAFLNNLVIIAQFRWSTPGQRTSYGNEK